MCAHTRTCEHTNTAQAHPILASDFTQGPLRIPYFPLSKSFGSPPLQGKRKQISSACPGPPWARPPLTSRQKDKHRGPLKDTAWPSLLPLPAAAHALGQGTLLLRVYEAPTSGADTPAQCPGAPSRALTAPRLPKGPPRHPAPQPGLALGLLAQKPTVALLKRSGDHVGIWLLVSSPNCASVLLFHSVLLLMVNKQLDDNLRVCLP